MDMSFIARGLEWRGTAVQDPDYTIWGCAPIQGDDGKIHLFAARWPEKDVDPAWRKSSEIAHYTADNPEGPFVFSDISLQGTSEDTWDRYAPHNPEIKKVDNRYVLLYTANSDFHQPPHPSNQGIGMAISESPCGPWRKVGRDGRILHADVEGKWTQGSPNGVTNPAFLALNGRYFLYFKAAGRKGLQYGLAAADNLEGPYEIRDEPVTPNEGVLEDASVFFYRDSIYLLTTDNYGHNTGIRGGGTLWKSGDGTVFQRRDSSVGYDRLPRYCPDYNPNHVTKIYGDDPKLERPKILMLDGLPAYLYGPGGWNIFGGERTVCYVLKITL